MLDQDINIELLNLFDLVDKSSTYLNYQNHEQAVLNDYDLLMMINTHNDLMEKYDLSHDDHMMKRINELQDKINNNEGYIAYLKSYDDYQKLMEDISKIIFKDIINIVKEGETCAH